MQRLDNILMALKHMEFITLNIASFGWVFLDALTNKLASTPDWITWGVGLSIMFFNIARGIAVLRKKKKD